WRALGLLLLFCWLAGAHLGAQDKRDSDKKDPQSSFEPRSAPGEGQKFLEKFVGGWDVEKTFYPRSGDAPFHQKGECAQTMIHDGRFLQSDFTFRQDQARTTGKGLLGFEASSGTFTSIWTDSRATRMSFRRSEGKFDGKEIVLYSRQLQGDEKGRASRTVTH